MAFPAAPGRGQFDAADAARLQAAECWWKPEGGFEIKIPIETATSYIARTRRTHMTATEQLRHEHETITIALSILEKLCQRLAKGEEVNPEHFGQVLEFIQVFADRCHHGKEEEFLFPVLEAAGIPNADRMLDVMSEHERCRILIRQLVAAWKKHRSGDRAAAAAVIGSARDYSTFLHDHISKEDNILFPMAEAHLSADSQRQLLEEFERLEIELIGAGGHEQFDKTLDFLRQAYLGGKGDGREKIQQLRRTSFFSELVSKWKFRIKDLNNRFFRGK
jgi:hemerythrin-like domain-containing protein